MYKGNRFHKKQGIKPLFFKNPFRSIGVKQRTSRILVGPMRREGITSIENEEKSRLAERIRQLSNAGMTKQMKELGVIPDDLGVNMSDYTGNIAALPTGVTSIENMEKQADIARQIERYNAGILDEDRREQKLFMDLAKKRQIDMGRQKIIQWIAETDELDSTPAEVAEEVEQYYRDHYQGNEKQKKESVKKKREQRKKREEEKQAAELLRRGYWQSSPFKSILKPATPQSTRYSANTSLNAQRLGEPEYYTGEDVYGLNQLFNEGYGMINNRGWRAPRLHKLVRPFKRFEIDELPDQIIEEQKQALDDRRNMYKDEQEFQRGTAPPKDMVERAMPKTAEPMIILPHKIPDLGITLHPFVFPKKKFLMRTGIF